MWTISWVRGLIFWPWWLFSNLLWRVMGQCVRKCQKREEDREPKEKLNQKEINRGNCPTCANLKSFEVAFNETLEEKKKLQLDLKELINKIEKLQHRNEELQSEISAVRKSSDNLTKRMATTLEKQSIFEDVSNPLAGMKLADRMNGIYSKEFEVISETLDYIIKDEVKVIRLLKNLMVAAYKTCCEKAEEQMRQFLFLSDNEKVPSQQEVPELYKVRCIASIQEDRKEKVVQDIVKRVVEQESMEEHILDTLDPETVGKLTKFLHEFTDCTWLMTVADKDQLILNFDVIGQEYKGNLSKQFKQYTPQGHVTGPMNTVVEVVWPSITMLNGQYLHAKGEVLLATPELNDEMNGTQNGSKNGGDSSKEDSTGTEV